MKSILIITIITVCVLFSCKKKHVPTKKEYLTKASWKRIKFEIKNNVGSYIEQDLNIPPYTCTKDDYITYKSDIAFVIDNGLLKCSANEARYENGTWAFGNNETTIEKTFTTYNTSVVIEILTESTLIYSYNKGLKRITYSH